MLKLKQITDPKFEIEVADGDVRRYDPWEAQEKIAALVKDNADKPDAVYTAVRQAFELPDLTRNQCLEVQAALLEFTNSLPLSKKLLSLSQS